MPKVRVEVVVEERFEASDMKVKNTASRTGLRTCAGPQTFRWTGFPWRTGKLFKSRSERFAMATEFRAYCAHAVPRLSESGSTSFVKIADNGVRGTKRVPTFRSVRFRGGNFLNRVPGSRPRQERLRTRYPPLHRKRLLLRVLLSLLCSF